MDLRIDPCGTVRCVYTEVLDLSDLGMLTITRASHIEPDTQGQWWSDLSPVHGPKLGPFGRRSEALAAEAALAGGLLADQRVALKSLAAWPGVVLVTRRASSLPQFSTLETGMKGSAPPLRGIARDLLYLRTPSLWPTWPFLALMRRRPGQEEEYGVIYDFAGTSGRTGYGATVFLSNLFLMPRNEEEMIIQPREVFDNADEIVQAGWRVD